MRPTVANTGLKIIDRQFIGMSLGVNFFAEHSIGASELLESINNSVAVSLGDIEKYRKKHKINSLIPNPMVAKMVSYEVGNIAKWDDTPFKDKVVLPDVECYTKSITIDNSEHTKRGNLVLLHNGHYKILVLANRLTISSIKSRLHRLRKIDECQLWNLNDIANPNYAKHIVPKTYGCSWGPDGIIMAFNDEIGCDVIKMIVNSIRNGNLAIVDEVRQLGWRGGCLVDLNNYIKMYYV